VEVRMHEIMFSVTVSAKSKQEAEQKAAERWAYLLIQNKDLANFIKTCRLEIK
jgi:hypothetical protein